MTLFIQPMVLDEENMEGMRFKYNSAHSALLAGIAGISCLFVAVLFVFFFDSAHVGPWVACGVFGVILIFACIEDIFSTQWLKINFLHKTVRFYKNSLFSFVEWEKQTNDFKCIGVYKGGEGSDWQIYLITKDGFGLELMGGNIWLFTTKSQALNFAKLLSNKTGIKIEENL